MEWLYSSNPKRSIKTTLTVRSDVIRVLPTGSGLKYHFALGTCVRFIDSHVHLADYPEVWSLQAFASASETLLLAAGVDRDTSSRCLELAQLNPLTTRAFVGVHPSEALAGDTTFVSEIAPRATGIGEIGLDPKYSDTSPGGAQMKAFLRQLEVAEALGKPVQVHTRGAAAECLERLSSYRLGRVLLHWFDEEGLATEAASRGFYVSFGPAILYSKRTARIADAYPDELILTESDGPVGFKPLGGVHGPTMVPTVVFRIAEIKRRPFEEVAELVCRNGSAYLGEPSKG